MLDDIKVWILKLYPETKQKFLFECVEAEVGFSGKGRTALDYTEQDRPKLKGFNRWLLKSLYIDLAEYRKEKIMYKIWDSQLSKYFWNGYIFKTKAEIVAALADFHSIDYTGVDDEDNEYEDIIEMFKDTPELNTIEKQLNWLLEYGEWEIEKVNPKDIIKVKCLQCDRIFLDVKDEYQNFDCSECGNFNQEKFKIITH